MTNMDDVQTTTVMATRMTTFNHNSSQILVSLPWRTGCIILQSNLCDISVTPKYKTLLEKLEDIGDWEVKADLVTFALLQGGAKSRLVASLLLSSEFHR